MTNNCPENCHESLKLCLKSKVSWKAIGSVIGFCIILSITGLTAWGEAKDDRKKNEKQIAINTIRYENISEVLNEIKQNQMSQREIIEAVKKAIQENINKKDDESNTTRFRHHTQ